MKQYEEIRDLLSANKLPGLSGQGVCQSEINDSQRELGVSFPFSYAMFLKEHGWGYFGHMELICGLGSDIPDEWKAGADLLRVVADERQGELRFPHDIIPICQNGAGDWYALDCSRSTEAEAPIVFVSHEEVASKGFCSELCASSFSDWIFSMLSENR